MGLYGFGTPTEWGFMASERLPGGTYGPGTSTGRDLWPRNVYRERLMATGAHLKSHSVRGLPGADRPLGIPILWGSYGDSLSR